MAPFYFWTQELHQDQTTLSTQQYTENQDTLTNTCIGTATILLLLKTVYITP